MEAAAMQVTQKKRPAGGWGRRAKAGGNEVTNTRLTEHGLHGKELPQSESEALATRFRIFWEMPLDVAGMVDAFRLNHSATPFTDRYGGVLCYETIREYPGFAYDKTAETWRKWEYAKGWSTVWTILPEMANIIIGLCAVDAVRSNPDGTADKIDKEYRARRVKSLGAPMERATRLAATVMAVNDWDSYTHLIGLPEGECLDIDATHTKAPVMLVDAGPSDYITKSAGASTFAPTKLWKDFLAELTGGDTDLEDGLQTWFGLAMLPGNPNHRAHILFGDGNTGKSTFLKDYSSRDGRLRGERKGIDFHQ